MNPGKCVCGTKVNTIGATTRVVGSARRRLYHCGNCGTYFATVELRVPPKMDTAVFQAKVRSMLAKEGKRGKEKGKAEVQART